MKFNIGDGVVAFEVGEVGIVTEIGPDSVVYVDWKTGPDRGSNKWILSSELVHTQDYHP